MITEFAAVTPAKAEVVEKSEKTGFMPVQA